MPTDPHPITFNPPVVVDTDRLGTCGTKLVGWYTVTGTAPPPDGYVVHNGRVEWHKIPTKETTP